MSHILSLLLVFICCIGSNNKAWGEEERLFQYKEPLMGTLFSIQLYAQDQASADKAADAAFAKAKQLEKILSSFDPESELSKLNSAPAKQATTLSPILYSALQTALDVAKKSDGAFDPTLGPYIRLWKRSSSRGELPSTEQLSNARAASGYSKLILKNQCATKTVEQMRIDLGGIGKGLAIDSMATVLTQQGIKRFCLSSSSDIFAADPPPQQEAWIIQHSNSSIALKHQAVSSSGDAQQHINIAGISYSHVIDPATGLGLLHHRQTSIIAPTACLADALATACSVLPAHKVKTLLLQYPGSSELPQIETK